MIIRYNSVDYDIPFPQYGYSTLIYLAMEKQVSGGKDVVWYDHTASSDYRTTSFNCKLNYNDNLELIDIMDKAAKARNDDISIVCTDKQRFFPFGPDLGNHGSFVASIVSTSPSAMLINPWRYFDYDVNMVLVSSPAYSFGADKTEGSLVVGSVTGLPYPDIMLSTSRNYSTNLTNDGTVARIDNLESDDYQTANFTFTGRLQKMQRLISYLTITARGNEFTIVSPGGNYLFGVEGSSGAIYTVILENNQINVTHIKPDKFSVSFSVRRKI